MLYVLNVVYTRMTGGYHFIDTNVPVLVFLGLHLLVTDPATSPRTAVGKIMFGGLYGVGVFGMFGALGWLGAPRFYEKILCVPALNLSVQALDRVGSALTARFRLLTSDLPGSPRQINFAYMALWALLFTTMMMTGFLDRIYPGGDPEYWHHACEEQRSNGCTTWIDILNVKCSGNSASACLTLGQVLNEGRVVPQDRPEAGKSFGRACELGLLTACIELREFVRAYRPNPHLRPQ